MVYKSPEYALAFNDSAEEIPVDLWRGTEIESYFDVARPTSEPPRSNLQAPPSGDDP